jgi:hypothetical protein
MNSSIRHFALTMLAATLLLGACKKDDDAPDTPEVPSDNTPSQTSPTPSFPDAAGVLWAVNTITSQTISGMPFEIGSGMGVAIFPTADNASAYIDAGTVKLNDEELTRQSDNSYVSIPTQSSPTGIDLSGGSTHWTVSGANGIPAVDLTPSFPFPTVGDITSSTTVVRSSGYTLTVSNVSTSDSVVFTVGSVVKMKPSGTTSCSFSAAELASVTAGQSFVQVSPYAYSHEVVSGKDLYFGKQTARTVSATIQ